jgi:hypothetical protein
MIVGDAGAMSYGLQQILRGRRRNGWGGAGQGSNRKRNNV